MHGAWTMASCMFLGEYPLDKRNSKTNRRDTPGDICIRSIPLWFGYFTWLSRRFALSSWGLVMRICVTELCHHWFRQWLVGFRCQTIVRTNADMLPIGAEELEESPVKLEWKYGRFSRVWIWNVVCKMLLRPQCVELQGRPGTALYIVLATDFIHIHAQSAKDCIWWDFLLIIEWYYRHSAELDTFSKVPFKDCDDGVIR